MSDIFSKSPSVRYLHGALFASSVILASGLSTKVGAQEAPRGPDLASLVEASQDLNAKSFPAYLDALTADSKVDGLDAARSALQSEDGPNEQQLELLARLLGVYNRVANETAALELLAELVAIETYASDDYPNQFDNPTFVAFGEKIAKVAEQFNLSYRNMGGRIFEVTLDGPSDDVFGVLTHGDVVPVQSRAWKVEEGVEVDPFTMQVIGNRIYGRGTLDDKGSIVTALFAMRAALESGLPMKRDIRLMIETTEETSGAGMEYYLKNEAAPEYNIVLDSDYPAVTAEKGYGTIEARFPIVSGEAGKVTISQIVGSAAANQIPERAIAFLDTNDATRVAQALNGAAESFIAGHGGDFAIEAKAGDDQVELTVSGTSAHASEPENGVNPVPRLAGFLTSTDVGLTNNHYTQALQYINEAYGLDYLGEQLSVGYSDDFMGPLTLSPTYFEATDEALIMAVNVRAPRHPETDAAGVQASIAEALEQWKQSANPAVSFDVTVTDWMVRDTGGTWLKTLLDIYGDTTGEPAEPVSSPGSTTAKLLPNAVNFGPNMPADKYMGHTENEFKRLDVMGFDVQMFTEMMVRISNLQTLK